MSDHFPINIFIPFMDDTGFTVRVDGADHVSVMDRTGGEHTHAPEDGKKIGFIKTCKRRKVKNGFLVIARARVKFPSGRRVLTIQKHVIRSDGSISGSRSEFIKYIDGKPLTKK
ncbi:hypothetical protein [Kordiimonas sp.]|uniref:hypothetical protein n=1 Tax=Kordiimonas sp. TaxID=1970157 RepID=UPI003A91EDAE